MRNLTRRAAFMCLQTIIGLIFAAAGISGQAMATTNYPLPLSQRLWASALVVEGTIGQSISYWDASEKMIYTAYKLQVLQTYKGKQSANIWLIIEGGQIEKTKIEVGHSPELQTGQSGIFFLNSNRNFPNPKRSNTRELCYQIYGAAQGVLSFDSKSKSYTSIFDIFDSKQTLQRLLGYDASTQTNGGLSNDPTPLATPTISSISGPVTAGTTTNVTINGTNFGPSYTNTALLEMRNANTGGSSYMAVPDNHIISWNATQIVARVPSGAGTGTIRITNTTNETFVSSQIMTVVYNHISVINSSTGQHQDVNLVNNNGLGGYDLAYNTAFAGNAAAVTSFERAWQSWRCNTFVNFAKTATTTSISCQANDGVNMISFDNACPLPAGVLGTSYRSSTAVFSGGNWYWFVADLDLKFATIPSAGLTWNYAIAAPSFSQYDFESVALHELGHHHQLGHVINPGAVMHFNISNGSNNRVLSGASDIAGGNAVMARSIVSQPAGPTAMVALNASNCPLNAPVANFSFSPASGCVGLQVTYTNTSQNTPASWSWSFAGGSPSVATGPGPHTITYAGAGQYGASLTVTNAAGTNTRTSANIITVTPTPVADFNISNANPCLGQSVAFSNISSSATSYAWTFASGIPANSVATNPSAVFNNAGTFSVSLTATSACGSSLISKSVAAAACPALAPVPSISGTPTSFCVGGSVAFSGSATNSPTSWAWTFGGGSPASSTAQNPTVSYASPGNYSVTLVATNPNGSGSITQTNYITVNACPPPAPVANFAASQVSGCSGLNVNFTDLSSNTPTSWSWTFSGGSPASSSAQNPSGITYTVPGTYPVSLTATNAGGNNTKTVSGYITVLNCVTTDFSCAVQTICTSDNVSFTDLSTGSPTVWNWSFPGGNPASASIANPIVVYNTPGIYNVTLTSGNGNGFGISKTCINKIEVLNCLPPTAAFAAAPRIICAGETVSFADQSSLSPTSWDWTFPGGTPASSTAQNPSVSYPAAGSYAVTLVSTNSEGSSDPVTINAYIGVSACPALNAGLLINQGATITVANAENMYVQGGIINTDGLANETGIFNNSGNVFVSGDWTNHSSNSNANTPSSSGRVLFDGSGLQNIGGNTASLFNNLILESNAPKRMNNNVSVENILDLKTSNIHTNNYKLSVLSSNPAAIIRTGAGMNNVVQGYVESSGTGRLVRNTASTSPYLFPVGSANPIFRPIMLTPTSATPASFGVDLEHRDPSLDGYDRNQKAATIGSINSLYYHKIDRESGSANATIGFYFDFVADNILNYNTLQTAWWSVVPGRWQAMSPSYPVIVQASSPLLALATTSVWTNFNQVFALTPQSVPLPIELLYFKASCNTTSNSSITFDWQTASEKGNNFFSIEGANQDLEATKLLDIKSKNSNSTSLQTYQTLLSGKAKTYPYYRLRQTDNNRATSVSAWIANPCGANMIEPSIYPVPARHQMSIQAGYFEKEAVDLIIIDMLGRIVSRQIIAFEDSKIATVNISGLPAGRYHCRLASANRQYSQRIQVLE